MPQPVWIVQESSLENLPTALAAVEAQGYLIYSVLNPKNGATMLRILGTLPTFPYGGAIVVNPTNGEYIDFPSSANTNTSRASALQSAMTQAQSYGQRTALYLSPGVFDLGSGTLTTSVNPIPPDYPLVPQANYSITYGSGSRTANGFTMGFQIYALVSGAWVPSYYVPNFTDNHSHSPYEVNLSWSPIPNATNYLITIYDTAITGEYPFILPYFQYYETASPNLIYSTVGGSTFPPTYPNRNLDSRKSTATNSCSQRLRSGSGCNYYTEFGAGINGTYT